MARNYDIAEFRETDALDPTATRKLNANFRRILELVNGIQVEGVDTDAIAQFVVSVLGGDIRALQGIVYANNPSHESRITALEALPPGGTSDYDDLIHKPMIKVPYEPGNPHETDPGSVYEGYYYHEVSGEKTYAELGLESLGSTEIDTLFT